jgi:AraC-like DNA-binding protein
MSQPCQLAATPVPGVVATSNDSAHRFPRHWHDSFGLGVMDRGAQRSASGRGVVEAWQGQCITHNPGEVHDGAPIGGSARRWRMLDLEPAALAWALDRSDAAAFEWKAPVMEDTSLRNLLHSAFRALDDWSSERQSAGVADALAFEEAFVLAVGCALEGPRQRSAPPQTSVPLQIVRERLTDDLTCAPKLDDLARLAGTSRFALVRSFAREHGLPPMAWLQQWRLHRARERIACGSSLADAASACGFSDQSHMTRVFRRQFGYTPGAWRAVAQKTPPSATAF